MTGQRVATQEERVLARKAAIAKRATAQARRIYQHSLNLLLAADADHQEHAARIAEIDMRCWVLRTREQAEAELRAYRYSAAVRADERTKIAEWEAQWS